MSRILESTAQLKSVQPPTVSAASDANAAAWAIFSLHFLSVMLRCALEAPQSDVLSQVELASYSKLQKAFERAKVGDLFTDLEGRLLAAFRKVVGSVSEGCLPLTLGHLLLSEPAQHLSAFSRKAGLEEARDRLTTVLSLHGILYNISEADFVRPIAERIVEEVSVVERRLFSSLGLLAPDSLRLILSLLFWARVALLERQVYARDRSFAEWWPLLETLRELQMPDDPDDLAQLDSEAEMLINIMRLLGELQTTRGGFGAQRAGTAGAADVRLDQLVELQELQEYAWQVLLERVRALAENLSSATLSSLPLATLYSCLRVLLDYHSQVLGPDVLRLHSVDQALRRRETVKLNADGSLFPQRSPAWRNFREQSDNVARRISKYAEACCRAPSRKDLKPFLLLVVGQPGTGKSQFVRSVHRALMKQVEAEGGKVLMFDTNLSQALSTTSELARVWDDVARSEAKAKAQDIHLVVLDEFDALIEEHPSQYRQVLSAFWDAQRQKPQSGEKTPLGPFVAICIMSKSDKLSSARRMLYGIEKGRDFLSRVDEVVEVPPFDSVETQQELILATLWRIFANKSKPPVLRVSEAAVWLLSWLQTTDNFRTISKTLKTVPANAEVVSYQSLNLGSDVRREFEYAIMEVGPVTAQDLSSVLSDETKFVITFTPDSQGDLVRLVRKSQGLLDILQFAALPSPGAKPFQSPAGRKARHKLGRGRKPSP